MKFQAIAVSVSLLFPFALHAADHGHMHSAAAKAETVALAQGTIKKVDAAGQKLTIAHGPIDNIGMPGMTMAFPVKKGAWLAGVKAGDKVRFQAEMSGSEVVVTHLEAAK